MIVFEGILLEASASVGIQAKRLNPNFQMFKTLSLFRFEFLGFGHSNLFRTSACPGTMPMVLAEAFIITRIKDHKVTSLLARSGPGISCFGFICKSVFFLFIFLRLGNHLFGHLGRNLFIMGKFHRESPPATCFGIEIGSILQHL